MSQTPPNGPQVPGQPQQPPVPQQPPMAQPPYQGAPPQAPQGYPQQPAAYPQQQPPAYPQQPYPGQPAYLGQQPAPGRPMPQGQPAYQGQQPAYQGQQPAFQGQQPAFQGQPAYQGQPPQGYRPQGGYPGQPQPPAGRASSSKILLIVAGAVALLVLAGGVLLMMSNRGTPTVNPVTPSPGPVPTQNATVPPTAVPTNTVDPTTAPTEEPTTEPTNQASGVIQLGNGVMFLPAEGWEVQEQAASAVSVGNGEAVVVTRVVQQKKTTNPGQLCDAFNRQTLADAPGAKFGEPKDQEISLKNLGLASCPAAFVSSSNGKSQEMLVVTFAAVRNTDGLSTLTTMLFTKNTSDATFSDIDQMLGVVLTTQSAG